MQFLPLFRGLDSGGKNKNYHPGRNSGTKYDGGEKIRSPVNFVHPCIKVIANAHAHPDCKSSSYLIQPQMQAAP